MSIIDWETDWQFVEDFGKRFPNISSSAIGHLAKIISIPVNLRSDEPMVTTKNLRSFLSPHFRNAETRVELCDWIVKRWGGIARHNERSFKVLIAQFGGFSIDECWAAADSLGVDRISSWSKLLSFAHPSKFAVFDARTSAALNILLARKGHAVRFFIPPTQNGLVARNRLRLMGAGPYLSYRDYVSALREAATSRALDLQDIEMTLFANSIAVCQSGLSGV